MELNIIDVGIGVGSFLVGGGLSVLLYIRTAGRKRVETEKKISTLEEVVATPQKVKQGVDEFMASENFDAIKEKEFLKGLERGREDTLNKFQIQYTEIKNVNAGWLKSTVSTGYQMQLYFNGLPIGDATIRMVQTEEKVDKASVEKLLQALSDHLKMLTEMAAKSGIPAAVVKAAPFL